jgi:hypothetical protein
VAYSPARNLKKVDIPFRFKTEVLYSGLICNRELFVDEDTSILDLMVMNDWEISIEI